MSRVETTFSLKIFLVKSGSTELEDQGRISGSLDLPLSEFGRDEADELASVFEDLPVNAVYSAACLAAQDTARRISKSCGKPRFRVEESWKNLDHGLWHGKCVEELKENAPKFYRQWRDNLATIAPPNGETGQEVAQRCKPALDKLLRKQRHGAVIIVAPQPLLGILEQMLEAQAVESQLELLK